MPANTYIQLLTNTLTQHSPRAHTQGIFGPGAPGRDENMVMREGKRGQVGWAVAGWERVLSASFAEAQGLLMTCGPW